jgi:hypothetical protein
MKNDAKWVLGLTGFIIVLFIVLSITGTIKLVPQLALGSQNSFVYCNDPTSLCCVKTSQDISRTLALNGVYVCESANGCTLTSVGTDANIYLGSQNCAVKTLLFVKYYKCSDDVMHTYNSGLVSLSVPKGYTLHADRNVDVKIVVYGQKLVTNLGVPVLSDSCTFSSASGEVITSNSGADLGTSYTVPVGEGLGTLDSCILSWTKDKRHICGDVTEACSSNADCTGGNKCTDRTLQTYGCDTADVVPSGVASVGGVYVQNINVNGYTAKNVVGSRCVIQSAKQVQCCGDTDCGSNMVCDTASYTCKASSQVVCTKNSQCGVSTQCDFSVNQLKTPICSGGVCGYKVASVGCCGDSSCAVGSFCNAQNTCEVRKNISVACPFECCQSDVGYFDRPCASGFCTANKCSAEPECSATKKCAVNYECKNSVCLPVQQTCKPSFFGLVDAQIGTKEECNFWCKVGLKQAEKVSVCVKDYTPLVLVIATVLVLGGMLLFANLKGKGKSRSGGKKSNWFMGETAIWKNKTFWIVLAIIGAVFFVIGNIKFFFWALVVLLVLVILFGVVFRKSFWKRIKRMIEGD